MLAQVLCPKLMEDELSLNATVIIASETIIYTNQMEISLRAIMVKTLTALHSKP